MARKREGTSAEPFTVEHFLWWSPRLVLDSGDPFRAEPFQLAFLEDLFLGLPENWFILPEGSAKTTLTGAIALYGLRFAEDPSIPVAASSRDQARIMYKQMKGFLRRSRLNDLEDADSQVWFEAFDGYRRIDKRTEGGTTSRGDVIGIVEIHAADAGTGDGIIPYPYAIIDELHRHKNLDLYETWRGKLSKRGAQLITISTAGEPNSDFEEARTRIRQETPLVSRGPASVRARSSQIVFHEYAVPENGNWENLELVKAANPLAAVTVDVLRAKRQSSTLSTAHWRRMTCNLATRSDLSAISEVEWANAKAEAEIPLGAAVDLGLDLGWVSDTTAIVPLWIRDRSFRLFGPATILEPPGDGVQLDARLVEAALEAAATRWTIRWVVMDMTKGEQLAQWIERELGAEVVDHNQQNPTATLDYVKFMEALREGWLKHSGDVGLTRHAMNAVARVLPGGASKFERPKESRSVNARERRRRHIDALDAASFVHTAVSVDLDVERAQPVFAWG